MVSVAQCIFCVVNEPKLLKHHFSGYLFDNLFFLIPHDFCRLVPCFFISKGDWYPRISLVNMFGKMAYKNRT